VTASKKRASACRDVHRESPIKTVSNLVPESPTNDHRQSVVAAVLRAAFRPFLKHGTQAAARASGRTSSTDMSIIETSRTERYVIATQDD
jgi:hypothetical protein